MKHWIAVYGSADLRIISVNAPDETSAREQVVEELRKPGRGAELAAWMKDGQRLIDVTGEWL